MAHVSENCIDSTNEPELIYRNECVFKRRGVSDPSQRDGILSAIITKGDDGKIPFPSALDAFSTGIHYDIRAGRSAAQIIEYIVDMPRTATVNDHLNPAGTRAGPGVGRPMGRFDASGR